MMIVFRRGLYSSPPPPPRESLQIDNNPTLLFSWFCTIFALAIVLTRLFGRRVRTGQLFPEDNLMFWSIVPLMARMGLIHVVLIFGTNNVDVSGSLTDEDIRHRQIGSKLVLASRICYAMFIWTAKFTVSEFLKRLTASYWKPGYQIGLHTIRIFLCVSFIGVIIATLSECQPFTHYWQVIPDPGPQCRQNYAQLFTMAVADVITDILLVVFPLTILIPASGMPLIRRLKLSLLFALSIPNIIITIWRVIAVVQHHGAQQRRTVYASGEILAAAAVSNVVILGSFLRDRGAKRTKWRGSMTSNGDSPSTTDAPSPRRQTVTRLAAGSDEDLFVGMCYRSSINDIEATNGVNPRPAPAVSHADLERHDSRIRTLHPSHSEVHRPSPAARSPVTKTVSFSDPGGLLERAPSAASTIANVDDITPDVPDGRPRAEMHGGAGRPVSSDVSTRAGSPTFLQDVGGLLGGLEEERTEEESEKVEIL